MIHRLSGKVLAFIRSQRVARVATVGRDGTPHNVPVCVVFVSGRLYFASEKQARKVRNIRAHRTVALSFDEYSENWKGLAGVMVVGKATVVDHGAAFRRVRQALYRKYKQYARMAPIEEGEAVIVGVTPTATFSWGL
jgi:nitroimidazol reductase NimA-like FMN-containing flavoprotein (pyridoxamine 5'-phosphate oxidase superfamily)